MRNNIRTLATPFHIVWKFTRVATDTPGARGIGVARGKKRTGVHRASGFRKFPAAAPRRVRAQNPVWRPDAADSGRSRCRNSGRSSAGETVDARRPGVYAPDDPRRAFVGALLSSSTLSRDETRLEGSVTRRDVRHPISIFERGPRP